MKTVIEIAREAGMNVVDDQYSLLPFLERFAELVRADEHEACAKFFDDNDTNLFWGSQAAQYIRSRRTHE